MDCMSWLKAAHLQLSRSGCERPSIVASSRSGHFSVRSFTNSAITLIIICTIFLIPFTPRVSISVNPASSINCFQRVNNLISLLHHGGHCTLSTVSCRITTFKRTFSIRGSLGIGKCHGIVRPGSEKDCCRWHAVRRNNRAISTMDVIVPAQDEKEQSSVRGNSVPVFNKTRHYSLIIRNLFPDH